MEGMRLLTEVFETKPKHRLLEEGDVLVRRSSRNEYRLSVVELRCMRLIRLGRRGDAHCPNRKVHNVNCLSRTETHELLNSPLSNWYRQGLHDKSWLWHEDHGLRLCDGEGTRAHVGCPTAIDYCSVPTNPDDEYTDWSRQTVINLLHNLDGWRLIPPTCEGHKALMQKFREATEGQF